MQFAPGGRATPGIVGILTAAAGTAVPCAIDGTRLDGGAVPVLTHSSSATKSARSGGVRVVGVWGFNARPGRDTNPGAAPTWGPGDLINPRHRRQFGIVPAGRV